MSCPTKDLKELHHARGVSQKFHCHCKIASSTAGILSLFNLCLQVLATSSQKLLNFLEFKKLLQLNTIRNTFSRILDLSISDMECVVFLEHQSMLMEDSLALEVFTFSNFSMGINSNQSCLHIIKFCKYIRDVFWQ